MSPPASAKKRQSNRLRRARATRTGLEPLGEDSGSGRVPWLTVRSAAQNNLKNIDVSIPLGRFVCITGVSGSGKSSLVNDILREQLSIDLNGATKARPGAHRRIDGYEHLDKVIDIDQSPIGRTPRSNPGTYIKVFDEIRRLYAQLPDSKVRGYPPGRFSFNVQTGPKGGGRCEACEGNGANKMEMDFLADVWVECPVCEGKRFNRETLSIYYRHKNIADVLDMDVQQALEHFQNIPKIYDMLRTLHEVGLDYLKLGQSSTTLSGGEAQRIKLARELVKRSTGRTLYLLDEPTTGLHFEDVKKLLDVLHGFVDGGNSVIVIEHNLEVLKTADWIIDLGPEGGAGGGRIVARGTPEQVAATPGSYTGVALADVLGVQRKGAPLRQAGGRRQPAPAPGGSGRNGRIREITVLGARQHNLKGIDVRVPREKMTVCSGLSGSGKTSLAVDTIYAEGQRRYVESLSAYARQFLGQVQKPKVDHVYGLSPAISIEQKAAGKSPRSTVGTVTEIYDYLRVLWARLGQPYCPTCDIPIKTQTSDEIVDRVLSAGDGVRALVLAPIARAGTESYGQLFTRQRAGGFTRVRIDGAVRGLDEEIDINHRRKHDVEIVVDRIIIRPNQRSRVTDSVEQALAIGKGRMTLCLVDETKNRKNKAGRRSRGRDIRFSQLFACSTCGRSYEEITPHHFSFNSRIGWCESCEGLGTQRGADPAAIVVNAHKSLLDGAIAGWGRVEKGSMLEAGVLALADHLGFDPHLPWNKLGPRVQRAMLQGGDPSWVEVEPLGVRIQWKGFYPAIGEASRASWEYRRELEHLTTTIPCTHCGGSRLRSESAAVRLGGKTLHEVCSEPIGWTNRFFKKLRLNDRQKRVAGELLREITNRLDFLVEVGLDYLSLGRSADTLSGGESQRIRLASQIGSGLTGVLYVLDEPTIGLHPRDNRRLIGALHRLRDLGNTLMLVEHDREVIEAADHVLDFGPGSGSHGGTVTAKGSPKSLRRRTASRTGRYLAGKSAIPIPSNRRTVDNETALLEVHGARAHNLRDVDAAFPLGRFTVVTGVSGSGKSSLVTEILLKALSRRIGRARVSPGPHEKVVGFEHVDKVINVDQSPIGNTPTSNPATYTGAFDLIRELFARLPESKLRGYGPNRFSFNRAGGRCESCEGNGQRCIEMHFLPDVWVECEECRGRRYQPETLEVAFKGKNIADVLEMRIVDALDHFMDIPKIRRILGTLDDVGLGYLQLGQAAPTLSGGEAQRVKLAAELARPSTGKTVYILDEPTTGLHFDDLRKLLDVLHRFADLGNTVICIEHNLDMIKTADWIIDLGPEAGADGGRVVVAGTPETVADHPDSHTGGILRGVLAAGPYERRVRFDPAQHARELLADKKPVDLGAAGVEARMPWARDGRKWHTERRSDETGEHVDWEGDLLGWVVDEIQKRGSFQPTNWNHRTRVEITSGNRDVSWFFHALTGDAWLLDLVFRIPRGALDLKSLADTLRLRTLDERDDIPVYGQWERVEIRRASNEFDELRLYVHDREELDAPAFRSFLSEAVRAYTAHVEKLDREPKRARPWEVNGKQWHLSQQSIRAGRAKYWKPPTLLGLVGAINKAVPGLVWNWNQKILVNFSSDRVGPVGRIVTNNHRALRVEVRTGTNHFTPTRVEGLGEEITIKRDRKGGDVVVFWIQEMSQTDPRKLTAFLREAIDSLATEESAREAG